MVPGGKAAFQIDVSNGLCSWPVPTGQTLPLQNASHLHLYLGCLQIPLTSRISISHGREDERLASLGYLTRVAFPELGEASHGFSTKHW